MRRHGITYEEVSTVAEALIQRGESPSISKVRELLGGTGSNTTLSKYLSKWRNEKAHSSVSSAYQLHRLNHDIDFNLNTNLSSITQLPDRLEDSVKSLWSELASEATAKYQEEKRALEKKVAEVEERASAIESDRDQIATELEAKEEQYNKLLSEKEVLFIDFKRLEEENRLLIERNKSQDERYQDYQKLTTAQMEEQKQSYKEEITRLEHLGEEKLKGYNELVEELRGQLESDRQRYMEKEIELKNIINKQQTNLDNQKEIIKEQKAELSHLKGELDAFMRERSETLNLYRQQDEIWKGLSQDITRSSEAIFQLSETPRNWETCLESINLGVTKTIDSKFEEFEDIFKRHNIAWPENNNE